MAESMSIETEYGCRFILRGRRTGRVRAPRREHACDVPEAVSALRARGPQELPAALAAGPHPIAGGDPTPSTVAGRLPAADGGLRDRSPLLVAERRPQDVPHRRGRGRGAARRRPRRARGRVRLGDGPVGFGQDDAAQLLLGSRRHRRRPRAARRRRPARAVRRASARANRASSMGFIFQAYNLIPVFSAVENVELPLLLAGVDAKEARAARVARRSNASGSATAPEAPARRAVGRRAATRHRRARARGPAAGRVGRRADRRARLRDRRAR